MLIYLVIFPTVDSTTTISGAVFLTSLWLIAFLWSFIVERFHYYIPSLHAAATPQRLSIFHSLSHRMLRRLLNLKHFEISFLVYINISAGYSLIECDVDDACHTIAMGIIPIPPPNKKSGTTLSLSFSGAINIYINIGQHYAAYHNRL